MIRPVQTQNSEIFLFISSTDSPNSLFNISIYSTIFNSLMFEFYIHPHSQFVRIIKLIPFGLVKALFLMNITIQFWQVITGVTVQNMQY